MKKNLHYVFAFALTALFGLSSIAQVTNEGTPLSWEVATKSDAAPVIMASFDLEALKAEDEINDLNKSKPYRFGNEFLTDFGIESAGNWTELENGDGVWKVNVRSEGAKTLNFVFDQYKLPEGATVYLYSDDREHLLGAYTSKMNQEEGVLGTWWVEGDNIWIEYHEPAAVRGQGLLNVGQVVHGYRSVTDSDLLNKGLNDSGACNLDVDCSIGADFDPVKELLKHSVGLVIGGGGLCTGTLLNNTALDETPYFLFANHCGFNAASSSFRFNWISPDPSCATTTNSTNGSFNSTSGATLLSTNGESDYRLFEITGGIGEDWEIEYSGWDVSDEEPDYTIGIHHPAGDIMKVCRNDEGLLKQDGGQKFWRIMDTGGETGWEQGVTEGGSSGSALYNEDGQLIGTLCCGLAACAGTNDNGRWDAYGRFAVSYNNNGLAQWLDPTDSGVTEISTLSQALGLADNLLNDSVTVYPNPTDGELSIVNRSGDELIYTVYNVLGQEVKSGTMDGVLEMIQLGGNPSGIYFLNVESLDDGTKTSKKIILK
ncbi:T9SS C-terminal target domain-containing protein [Dokdonia sinensis]|uniref:T9SS C-terminal target domain-containing protein n=1 Tax=Dokdonia sinensis TaxID=2479847 RepID=A0A3M0G7P0_9FLAO|nr:T9SS type A sorting domain-containing protein [Dokdonia sinensis]RMB60934.1 T9SS C-terminal target domain-containing protein [Dokdonia sinensis]